MAKRNVKIEYLENEFNLNELLDCLSTVSLALCNQKFFPVLNGFCFDGDKITAFNDIQAVEHHFNVGFKCVVPGKELLALLRSYKASGSKATVKMVLLKDANALQITCGRSKVKLSLFEFESFPDLDVMQSGKVDEEVECNFDLFEGISNCLISAGNDTTSAILLGITIKNIDEYTY